MLKHCSTRNDLNERKADMQTDNNYIAEFDIAVVGAGHAGCEAALRRRGWG